LEENKSLNIEGEPDDIQSERKTKQEELKRVLQLQIEDRNRKLLEEREIKRKQDELEEERVRKEIEQEQERLRIEKEQEQKKYEDARRQNEELINNKNKFSQPMPKNGIHRLPTPPSTKIPDYSNYEQASKDYSMNAFAPGQAPPEYQPPGPVNREKRYENDVFVNGDPAQKYHRLPNWPMRNFDVIHKENLVKELQLMLKQNLEVEAEKLKEEFQFNQKEFTDQIDKLKQETERAILQRNAARKELGRLKDELEYKRDYDENYSKQLMIALTRYNPANMYRPPKEDPTTVGMVAPFRGAGIPRTRLETPTKRTSYEKLFFQDVPSRARELNGKFGSTNSVK
jgi:flagellar biosynthesis GTPase FlhF